MPLQEGNKSNKKLKAEKERWKTELTQFRTELSERNFILTFFINVRITKFTRGQNSLSRGRSSNFEKFRKLVDRELGL